MGYVKYYAIEEYIKECLLAYTYYVEYGWSLRKCADNLCMGTSTVRNRLKGLEAIDPHKYKEYKEECKRRQGHR